MDVGSRHEKSRGKGVCTSLVISILVTEHLDGIGSQRSFGCEDIPPVSQPSLQHIERRLTFLKIFTYFYFILLLYFIFTYFYFRCESFVYMCVCAPCICSTHRDQKRPKAIVHSVTGSCNTVTKSFQVSQGENKIKFIMKRGV